MKTKLLLFFAFITLGLTAQTTHELSWTYGSTAQSLSVELGDTVVWYWDGYGDHNLVKLTGPETEFGIDTDLYGSGHQYSYTFTTIGVNTYNCTPHPDGMNGTITVSDPCDGVTGAPAIADDFDADSVDILEYAGDNAVVITVMDGAAIGGSGNVLEYVDNGGTYANVQLRTCNKFDMALTNTFTMDVYIDGSSLTGEQTNKVQFKLQDKSMGGNAWQSQVVAEVAIDAVDTWQTVVFDFTGTEAMNREDFDQVVIQFNGENNSDNVTAYIDNLQSANALGLDTVNTTSNFTFFPNPVNNVLTIKAQASIDSVIVYNMLGQAVVRSTPNTNDSTVDMSALQTGAYFVQVSINNTLKTVRVIKN